MTRPPHLSPGQCAAPTTTGFYRYHCLRPASLCDGDHLDRVELCPACLSDINPLSVFGPAQPARVNGGTARFHRMCAEALAGELAGAA